MSAPQLPLPPFLRRRASPLRGREEIVDGLVELVTGAADGRGAARTLVGEAGVGKTSILEEVVRRVSSQDVQAIRLKGLQAEVEMAWSGLAGLLEGLLGLLSSLPPERASAIRAVLALEGGSTPIEPFAVAVAARDLLVAAADSTPIAVFVDDLPWLDKPSRLVLTFLAEDLDVERIAIIATRVRGTDASTDIGTVVKIGELPADAADALLVDAGVSSPDVRATLLEACGGNPLVLVEAANLLQPDERAGRAALPDPLPVGRTGRRAAELLLEQLDPEVRNGLVAVAADSDGDVARVRTATARLGCPDAIERAAAAGVVTVDEGRVSFRHPLIRAATYHGASRSTQRAAHRAIATTLPERSPTRAWHLARATLGTDEEVAAALEAAATMTAHVGAPALAARTWEAASRLSPATTDRARRLRLAAAAELEAGLTSDSSELLARAESTAADAPDEPLERTQRMRLRCRLPISVGGIEHPAAVLRGAAAEVLERDASLTVDLLLDALEHQIDDGALGDVADTITDLQPLRERVDADRARRIDIVSGGLMIVLGRPDGEPLFERYREIVGPDRSVEDTSFLIGAVAPALGYFRRTQESDELLGTLEAGLRTRGAIRPLIDVLGAQAMAAYGRSFPAGMAAALEAVTLAEGLGTPELASLAATALALTAAVVGDRQRCEQGATLLELVSDPERRALGPIALAYLALNQGRLGDALAMYPHIAELSPPGHSFIRWETEWVEALARVGRREEAAAVLARLVSDGQPAALPAYEYARAAGFVAADDEQAYRRFAVSAEEAARDGNPYAQARALLAWGEQLRRARRRADARVHLERAAALFEAIGANVFADRARSEIRAAGGHTSDEVVAHRLLTPHELQIARLVVGGSSTRDVAAKLFISPRTIEAHLSTIFRKIGVRNRAELAARALQDPVLQP